MKLGTYCTECGKLRTAGARFCEECGATFSPPSLLSSSTSSSNQSPETNVSQTTKLIKRTPTNKRKINGWLALALIVGFFGIIGAIFDESDDSDRTSGSTAGSTPTRSATQRPLSPTPTWTTDDWDTAYPLVDDVRNIVIRPGGYMDGQMQLIGEISTIRVAPSGRIYELGNDGKYKMQTVMTIDVRNLAGSTESIAVGFDGDSDDLFEGTAIVAYGTFRGSTSGENVFGAEVHIPLLIAERVTISRSS